MNNKEVGIFNFKFRNSSVCVDCWQMGLPQEACLNIPNYTRLEDSSSSVPSLLSCSCQKPVLCKFIIFWNVSSTTTFQVPTSSLFAPPFPARHSLLALLYLSHPWPHGVRWYMRSPALWRTLLRPGPWNLDQITVIIITTRAVLSWLMLPCVLWGVLRSDGGGW